MKVDAPGLVAATQRLTAALEALGGSGVAHPPLAADPASVVAAQRLTTAGAELTAALLAHVSALVASVEVLTGAAFSYLEADAVNAAALGTLQAGLAGGATGPGSAPPASPIPADRRVPMPPPAGMAPKAISVAVHSGAPGDGEAFIGAWSAVAGAARNGAATIRSAVAELPEILDGPMSTPAVTRHLLGFAAGLDTYADRAHSLVNQAKAYASNQIQARADIPTPQKLTTSENNVRTLMVANAASGGKHAGALARAVSAHNQLNERAVTGYPPYHARTDAATAGDDPGVDGQGLPIGAATGEPSTDPAGLPDPNAADPNAEGLSPEAGGEMAALLPQLLPSLLGAGGGLVGGAMGAVTKVPEALMQAGSQALGAATQGLSGLAQPKLDHPGTTGDPGLGSPDPGGAGGGGEAPTTPAAGDGVPDLPVAPSTGAPPTPAIAPVGASEGPGAGGAAAGATGMTPMGMPMGGLGGPPGGGANGKAEDGRRRKVVVPEIPHTEDVTGRVDTSRLSAAAAASHRARDPEPPDDDAPDPGRPIVRRLVTRAPKDRS
jgi:hypothetical protein